MTITPPVATGSVQVRELRPGDVPRAVDLHRRSLPSSFFDRLGPRFLRAYHRGFADSPHGVALEAVDVDRLLGILVGTTDNAAHHRWVLRHRGGQLGVLGVLGLLGDPRLVVVFARTRALRYARAVLRRFAPSAAPTGGGGHGGGGAGRVAVLTHVVVDGSARRHGVGEALVHAFSRRAHGAAYIALVTLDGPEGAAPFYDHLGWRRHARRRDHDGRPIIEYRQDLSEEPPGA